MEPTGEGDFPPERSQQSVLWMYPAYIGKNKGLEIDAWNLVDKWYESGLNS